MDSSIDSLLQHAFTPDNVVKFYLDYKYSKWDKFSPITKPVVNVPMGADGVTHTAFENQIDRHARNICSRVLSDKYIFYPFREVDKPKNPAKPLADDNKRTLGIASIRDAVVQSVLYTCVLYDPLEQLFKQLDEYGPVSFAYRKGKSAPLAAQKIHHYITAGYMYGYDFDLRKYFDSIPHESLLNKVAAAVGGDHSITYRLIRRFVRVDRVPNDSYKYVKGDKTRQGLKTFYQARPLLLRPKPRTGVPQGGMLSGMLANLYLHNFDEWIVEGLGSSIDLKYVRYADDFIVLLKDAESLGTLKQTITEKLESPEFGLLVNAEKTKPIDITHGGLDFVGFHFTAHHISAKETNIERYKQRIAEDLNQAIKKIPNGFRFWSALKSLVRAVNPNILGFQKPYTCPRCNCQRQDAPKNWSAFFSVVTDYRQVRQLDSYIRQQLYIYARSRRVKLSRRDLRRAGLKSISTEIQKSGRGSIRPCLCAIEQADYAIGGVITQLYRGKTFYTIAKRCEFYVPYVNEDSIQVSISGKQHHIKTETMQAIWDRLRSGELVARAQLDDEGIRNSSQIVALLRELPGVIVEGEQRITLAFRQKSPARFLDPNVLMPAELPLPSETPTE